MLVLHRKNGEKIEITIGEYRIQVTVLDSNKGRVKLGFIAEQEVTIMRHELLHTGVN